MPLLSKNRAEILLKSKQTALWMSDRRIVLPHRLPPQQVGVLVEGRGHGFGAAIIRIVFEKGGMRNIFN